ncbi:hypothetical protein M5K25_021888 [Dendrobium thyrsiflorum]|uniref:Uncharacterized protein n=1 Tax=Dendrobium thyrsiflorum TaxID=117978 RepID=A0ABD0U545_DENTH
MHISCPFAKAQQSDVRTQNNFSSSGGGGCLAYAGVERTERLVPSSVRLLVSKRPLAGEKNLARVLTPACDRVLPLRTLDSWARRSPTVATVPRRLFLVSAYAIWDALTGGAGGPARAASTAVRRGMLLFRQGNVSESLAEFDRAIVLDPRQKACKSKFSWKFKDTSHISIDFGLVKEAWIVILPWCGFFSKICRRGRSIQRIQMILRSPFGASSVKLKFMEWMKQGNVGPDSRLVMREVYNMFKDGGDPQKLVSSFSNARKIESFYASLYAGLYYESQNELDAAKVHIVAACQTPYGSESDDYMAALAKVHCTCRNWSIN